MKFRDITCLSDLYYIIGDGFTGLMVAIAYIGLPFALDIWNSPFSFFMCASLAFVGVAADYKDREHDMHFAAACISAVCSMLWVLHVCPIAMTGLTLAAFGMFDHKRSLLWYELACFLSVAIAFICHYNTI